MIGFRWHIQLVNGEIYEPIEKTFSTYAECIDYIKKEYPEYLNEFSLDVCHDDDGFITILFSIEGKKILELE